MSGRHLRRELLLVSAFVAALLAVPSIATAGVPAIASIGQVQHHASISWTLPAGTATRSVEVSDSPAVGSDGAFFGDHVKSADSVTDGQTTYLSTQPLAPGTYYVHVAGYVPNCDVCPGQEWSPIATLVVPTFVQAVVQGSGQVTGPAGLSCAVATCLAADVPAGPVLLTATPADGWVVLSWQIDGIDPSDACGIAHKTCRVTTSATRSSTVTVVFAPAQPTSLHAGAKAYACSHRIEVVNPVVQPRIDTEHPYLGTLTISLGRPSGKTISRKLTNVNGYFSSPDFFKLQPAKTYTVVLSYSGDEWRPAKRWSRAIKLGRC